VSELARWLFYSPRRLYTAGAGTLLAVLTLVIAFTAGRATQAQVPVASAATKTITGASPSSSPMSVGRAPSPTPSRLPVGVATPTAIGPPIPVAAAFVRAWAAHPVGQTQQQWLAAVRPYATPKLSELLAYTDIVGHPNLTVAGPPALRYSAATSAQISQALSDKSRVLVTVTRDVAGWKVFDIEPDAGDFGSGR